MARLYRLHPDSRSLSELRILSRVLCAPGSLVATVNFYRGLTTAVPDMDMDIPEAGLHVVACGPFLVLEIDPAKLDRASQAGQTHVTVLCANLDETVQRSVDAGAKIVQEKWSAPPGPGFRLRHPDGQLVEYLEHRPSPDDVDQPGEAFR